MKIGIFGNTNNYPMLLALGLRQLGHQAVLVVNRKERLHRPEAKYPELERGYPEWILDASSLTEDDFIAATPRLGEMIDFLALGSGGLVLNDVGPSLLEFCPMPAIALMTGSDLTYYANRQTREVRQQGWSHEYTQSFGARLTNGKWDQFVERQRAGIRAATMVSAPFPGLVPAIDDILREIGVPDARRDFFWLADTLQHARRERRANPPLRIVNGARLIWKKPLPPGFGSLDHKGTDVLLAGFAEFIRSGGDAELVMFRKGLHVAETEELAQTLGVASRIVWKNEVSQRQFGEEIASADIVCDQLGDAFPGLVALDAMAMGVPAIANFRLDVFGPRFPEPMPVCQARTPSEVAGHLSALSRSEGTRVRAGIAAMKFARTYLSPMANAARCLAHLGVEAPAPAGVC